LKNAGLLKEDIDLIIVATATTRSAPSTAAIVQDKIERIMVAFDISAVCGFFICNVCRPQFIASGVYDNVLVIGADTSKTD
jgi:3-oxoacyl-[acyl-carrier-protein] synthase-3